MEFRKDRILEELKSLARKADTPIIDEQGSENITIYFSELDALEKAIIFIDKVANPNWLFGNK